MAGLVLHLVVVAHRGGSCYLRNPGDPVQVGAVLILAALGVVAVLVLARVALVPLGLAVGSIHLSTSFDFGLRVVFQSKTVGNERRRRQQQKLGPGFEPVEENETETKVSQTKEMTSLSSQLRRNDQVLMKLFLHFLPFLGCREF